MFDNVLVKCGTAKRGFAVYLLQKWYGNWRACRTGAPAMGSAHHLKLSEQFFRQYGNLLTHYHGTGMFKRLRFYTAFRNAQCLTKECMNINHGDTWRVRI